MPTLGASATTPRLYALVPCAGVGARSGANGPGFSVCRPATVVQDSPGLLAVWLAPGTECVRPAFADGSRLDDEPLATRYTRPRTTMRAPWTGMGVLKLAEPGRPWSVWLFWERHWRFKNWYVNLEAPRDRWAGGVDSEDHFLDIAVYPDRSWEWLDEDEFAQAREAGLLEQLLSVGLRSRNPERRREALESLEGLAALAAHMRHLMLIAELRQIANG